MTLSVAFSRSRSRSSCLLKLIVLIHNLLTSRTPTSAADVSIDETNITLDVFAERAKDNKGTAGSFP